jgi:ribosomal protein L11 methyltransferase
MIKAHVEVNEDSVEQLEETLYGIAPHNWVLNFNHSRNVTLLEGYFKDIRESENAFNQIIENGILSELPSLLFEEIDEEDWQNAYKKHFHPWKIKNFHWIPVWKKDSYLIPKDHLKLYMDPGMAFGTGNHETTKLCLESLVTLCEKLHLASEYSFLDVGCGSGILAMTASLLGFKKVDAIDFDPLAIKVSGENANINEIDNINFETKDLNAYQPPTKYDFIVANIQADVLQSNAKQLIKFLNKNGYLILSGILNEESEQTKQYFQVLLDKTDQNYTSETRTMNQWSLIIFQII